LPSGGENIKKNKYNFMDQQNQQNGNLQTVKKSFLRSFLIHLLIFILLGYVLVFIMEILFISYPEVFADYFGYLLSGKMIFRLLLFLVLLLSFLRGKSKFIRDKLEFIKGHLLRIFLLALLFFIPEVLLIIIKAAEYRPGLLSPSSDDWPYILILALIFLLIAVIPAVFVNGFVIELSKPQPNKAVNIIRIVLILVWLVLIYGVINFIMAPFCC
jgi:hypothetical protein